MTATTPVVPQPEDAERPVRALPLHGVLPPDPGAFLDRPVYDPFSARRRRTPEWLVSYTVALVLGDLLAAGAGLALAGLTSSGVVALSARELLLALAWVALLAATGAHAERRFGTGSDEYRRVLVAGLVATSALAAAGALFPWDGSDGLLLVAAPTAVACTLAGRLLNRRRLHAARRRGLMTKRVVVLGRDVAVADLVRRLRRDAAAGLRVVGACVPRPDEARAVRAEGIPVIGTLSGAVRAVDDARADAVVVASASETAGEYLRQLAWRLEGTNIEVLVGPGLIEVSSDRLQVRPTSTVPLIQVQEPDFRGWRRLAKSLLDRAVAGVLLLVGSPVLLGIALAVRATSRGPALYRHRRIGKRGREFDLLKFRSMVVGADSRIAALMTLNEGNDVQFKMRRDPRVTRVGAWLRAFSLDELPQLVNVLKGDMSLVGPRPHVIREVEQYGADMHRRLLVKPGITGLWQVSGRSDLSWDESVELDVRYVENWSFGLDLAILWRTVRAVLRRDGAY
ncbi:sugar transferase [Geodermatophilus aquaeductus]|uniref:Undecaprenyl-phosphate galactose phosphotransferase, WbaP/exopolysaccharide biosynthesis polyprenyl glycosylphosphotransferase n=1 Tax=Geodermatophilus aquaeductus TaxID=1564161 RepID=A0A521FQP0_9ACTN|nr:sugar transferase [Geodermatophilus aquaeductus]SMO98509.1 Undecaprenyl-phosphate galactose phosphotransferase, WbaP/exopolysaccharide biosynthesis polyprenyl glycosylphosphotransferase [Geodermatophilus aquaeductus]